MSPVEDYILSSPHESTKQLMRLTHQLLLDCVPGISHAVKWKVPFYRYKKPLCYLNPKPDHLILGWVDGVDIADPEGLLVGRQKRVRHYIIRKEEEVFSPELMAILMQATLLQD